MSCSNNTKAPSNEKSTSNNSNQKPSKTGCGCGKK